MEVDPASTCDSSLLTKGYLHGIANPTYTQQTLIDPPLTEFQA